MPKNKHLKGAVSFAIAKAEAAVDTFPTHFYDIEEAKAYIGAICKQVDFKYIASRCVTGKHITDEELEYVKDKAYFLVAVKAFKQGEFYLKVGLADPRALRAAVEADIKRLLPLVPYWPSCFSDVQDALIHIDGVARWKQFAYTKFEGVEQKKFRSYVNYNTVRHAFEAGRFDMDTPGEDWQRTQPKLQEQQKKKKVSTAPKMPNGKFATMKKAIESDMQRLLPLISPWPTSFPSLNAARDHAFRFTQSIRFPFSYWPDVEPGRFRLFVNFNTAKRALKQGKFKIDGQDEEDGGESDDTDMTAVEAVQTLGMNEVSTLAYDGTSVGSAVTSIETTLFSASTPFDKSISLLDSAIANTAITTDTIPASLSDEPLYSTGNVQEGAQEIQMPPVVEVDEDPFKDLIATLKRESILKLAFD